MKVAVVAAILAVAVGLSSAAPAPLLRTVCPNSTYCCPDAKHCLMPTHVSCLNHPGACDRGEVCCPLTKICVKPDSPCVSPCRDQGAYCCPDALHCLTPTNPGVFCHGQGQGNCKEGEVCCPLTKLCVKVGAPCTPPFEEIMRRRV